MDPPFGTYAMPAPRQYLQSFIQIKGQPQAGSSRTPYGPSPISTPGISDTTSESLSQDNRHNDTVRGDGSNPAPNFSLPQRDGQATDITVRETPSFEAWMTQRRAQEAHDTHGPSRSSSAASSQNSLNPHAGEFVPMAARPQGAPRGQQQTVAAPQVGLEVLRLQRSWMSPLHSGTATKDPAIHRELAKAIVHMGEWDGPTMQEFVEMLVQRAMESNGENLTMVAPFAKAIQDAFGKYGGNVCAAAFREHLQRQVWHDFEGFWKPDRPASLLSPHRNLPQRMLTPALANIMLIGELFAQGLVDAKYVYGCMALLVDDMCVIEQLRAVRLLFSRLDYRLHDADPVAMAKVVHAIAMNAHRLVPGQSALGETFDYSSVKAHVDVIQDVFHRWDAVDAYHKKTRRILSDGPPKSDHDVTPRPSMLRSPTPRANPLQSFLYVSGQIGTPANAFMHTVTPFQ
ncbi:hypothetical protein OH77DRAFT_1429681 [Trametes cingulata]|nr:hypothetical protein OH77DRAFT_1429681 [Trametes cingulata]